jgi:transposase
MKDTSNCEIRTGAATWCCARVRRNGAGGLMMSEEWTALPHVNVEIVKRPDTAVGFKLVPRRWIVERTIAWLNRCRRLAKDWENLNRKALAFLRLASIRLMLRKLCNPN